MGTHPIFESDFDCLTVQRVEIGMASAIDELLAQFPEMDPVLLKCIKFLQIGGKEGRKGIKDMTNEIFTTRSTSPLAAAQAKSDKRKASQAAVGQSEKKPRMELDSGFDTKPGSNISTGSAASSEGCKTCGDPSIKGKQRQQRQIRVRFGNALRSSEQEKGS